MFFVKQASRVLAENFSKFALALLIFLVTEVSISAESAPCQSVTYEDRWTYGDIP